MIDAPLVSISLDNFAADVLSEACPVLLICMLQDAEFEEQLKILKNIADRFKGRLKICFLEENSIEAFRQEFTIKGTPTFLIFLDGKEKNRLLGHADEKRILEFLFQNLSIS